MDHLLRESKVLGLSWHVTNGYRHYDHRKCSTSFLYMTILSIPKPKCSIATVWKQYGCSIYCTWTVWTLQCTLLIHCKTSVVYVQCIYTETILLNVTLSSMSGYPVWCSIFEVYLQCKMSVCLQCTTTQGICIHCSMQCTLQHKGYLQSTCSHTTQYRWADISVLTQTN